MSSTIIVGVQAGDEGKGKITDILAEYNDLVVRWQGGNNAGHTIVFGGIKYTVHLMPSGVFHGKRSLIANGVVLNPEKIIDEITTMKKAGFNVDLGIDPRTNIIMPWHIWFDGVEEKSRQTKEEGSIGTTGRGIGPCYGDKYSRNGIRFEDLIDENRLEDRVKKVYPEKEFMLKNYYKIEPILSQDEIIKRYTELGRLLKPCLTDVSKEVINALVNDKDVLFEGAQGAWLDVVFGTYPKVTSSNPIAGAIPVDVGVPLWLVANSCVIGITKAYVTRVGSQPMPTCLDRGKWPVNESVSEYPANIIRERGQERGTTTGRPRRVGYLDLVQLKYAVELNGVEELVLTKSDVMAGLPLKVCVAYELDNKRITEMPTDIKKQEVCKPIYKELSPLEECGEFIQNYEALPKNWKEYIEFIEEYVGVPVNFISYGPSREQTIIKSISRSITRL